MREFARRVRKLNISFHCSAYDARSLSEGIKEGIFADYGIPASVRFDRIEVSNIFDVNYVGIEGVLNGWASLLKPSKTAAIVGCFMNWVAIQPDGRAQYAGREVTKQLLNRLMKEDKVRIIPTISCSNVEYLIL